MGNNEIDEDVMPVFLINGFLEAGKTQFLEFTMDQEYFQTEGKITSDRLRRRGYRI